MVDIMKGVKWAVGWKDKKDRPILTPEQIEERKRMRNERMQSMKLPNPKVAGTEVKPLVYPLPPSTPRQIKKLPTNLVPRGYDKGKKVFIKL